MRHAVCPFVCAFVATVSLAAPGGPDVPLEAKAPPLPKEVVVFKAKAKGYAGFRIPAITKTKDGTLLAFAEGRKKHLGDDGDIDTLVCASKDGGATWGEPQVIADAGADFIGNPAPAVDPKTGAITVLMTWKKAGTHEGAIREGKAPAAEIWAVRSTDGGRTWDKPAPQAELNKELLGRGWRWNIPGPGHVVALAHGPHAGRLVCAANHSAGGGSGNAYLGGNAFLSDDGGKTWKLGAVDAAPAGGRKEGVAPNESAVAEWEDGTLVFSTRNQGGKAKAVRGIAWSRDGGETFVAPYAPDEGLTGAVCAGGLLAGHDAQGRPVLLASLPAAPRKRENMRIRLSHDLGKTWQPGPVLKEGPAAYSDLVEVTPGRFIALIEPSYGDIVSIPFVLP